MRITNFTPSPAWVTAKIDTKIAAIPPSSGGGAMIGNPTFIQATAPTHIGPYQWWDTSNAVLTLWVEDGV